MKRPSLLVRVAGSPPVAILLFVVYSLVVIAWYQEAAPWWLALLAGFLAIQTPSAVREVRRYKVWAAEWRAMGEPVTNAPALPTGTPPRRTK
jgi:hypothetical protein